MGDRILEMITQCLTEERIGEIAANDEEYQSAKRREIEIHNKFEATLSDEQMKLFDDFISAAAKSEINLERINYQQGMKDMFALIKALSL